MSEPGTMAPALGGSPRVAGHRDYVIKVLLGGLTGPLAGRTYGEVMVPMSGNTDEYVASVASYVRNAFGNSGTFVTPEDVARVRAESADRTTIWTYPEVAATLPVRLTNELEWTLTASHNGADARRASSLQGWQSRTAQQPGMWFQIELPEPTQVSEIQFESPSPGGRGGRGRGGAGGARGGTAAARPASTAPRAYTVQASDDRTRWSTPVAQGEGTGNMTIITFPPVSTRFLRMTLTAAPGDAATWAVRNLTIYGPGAAAQ